VVYAGGAKGAPAPTGQQLLANIAAAAQAKLEAHEEKTLATRLMERPAKPGTIVEEARDDKLDLTRLTLSNGVKVILKPTTFRKDQVLLGALRYGGQSLFDATDLPNVRHSGPVVGAMGLGDFSPVDLHKIMAGRSAAVTVGLGNYTDTIGGASGASADNVETMLQFLWLRFHGVRRDEGLYKTYMDKQEELVRNRLAAPEARFSDAVTDALYGGHPYEPRATTSQDLAKVDLAGSVAAYRQRFSSAKGLTFVLVGDFDVATIKPLLAAYLGTLPVTDLPLDYRDVGLRYAKGVVKKEVRAGTEPKSIVALTFTGPATWSPVEALRMQALVEVMNLRVFEVLREKRGLIYSGGLSGSLSRIPDQHYQIGTALPTAPEKVDQLVAALFEETARMKAEGPTQAELDKFKANWRQSHARQLQENAYWLGGLQATLMDGTDPQRLLTIEDDVNALSPADVQAAARRYFNQDNYVQVVMNPEVQVKTAKAGGE
jgi:zinc protease